MPDFIDAETERALVDEIDKAPWLCDLKRRVQHYGYKYDYKSRNISGNSYLGPLPAWANTLASRLKDQGIFREKPDQVIVNDYLPGQGIAAHIDCIPCFGDVIASVSLNSAAMINFTCPPSGEKHEIYLQPRSLITLSKAARYQWQHSIPARKSDKVDGQKIFRDRRISLTFRKVIIH
jgi:alkylated DNA repair dioxygenase AlkB